MEIIGKLDTEQTELFLQYKNLKVENEKLKEENEKLKQPNYLEYFEQKQRKIQNVKLAERIGKLEDMLKRIIAYNVIDFQEDDECIYLGIQIEDLLRN
jgi:hypothetical protein